MHSLMYCHSHIVGLHQLLDNNVKHIDITEPQSKLGRSDNVSFYNSHAYVSPQIPPQTLRVQSGSEG